MIREWKGIPRRIPTADEIRQNPQVVSDYLRDFSNAVSAQLQEINQYINRSSGIVLDEDTYIVFNSTNGFIEFFIGGTREGHLDPTTGWVTD